MVEAETPKFKEVHVNSSDKKFLSFLLAWMYENAWKNFRESTEKVSQYMHTLDTKCEANLYRKQYGNLKQALKLPQIETIFWLDANIIRFQEKEKIYFAKEKGYISAEDYQGYLDFVDRHLTYQLGIKKNLGQNHCKVCNMSYKETINKPGLCKDGAAHTPKYDFGMDPDVLKCEI